MLTDLRCSRISETSNIRTDHILLPNYILRCFLKRKQKKGCWHHSLHPHCLKTHQLPTVITQSYFVPGKQIGTLYFPELVCADVFQKDENTPDATSNDTEDLSQVFADRGMHQRVLSFYFIFFCCCCFSMFLCTYIQISSIKYMCRPTYSHKCVNRGACTYAQTTTLRAPREYKKLQHSKNSNGVDCYWAVLLSHGCASPWVWFVGVSSLPEASCGPALQQHTKKTFWSSSTIALSASSSSASSCISHLESKETHITSDGFFQQRVLKDKWKTTFSKSLLNLTPIFFLMH